MPVDDDDDDEDDNEIDGEDDLIGDIDDIDEAAEEEEGIDLFADNFFRDERERQDQETYQGRMIDDEGEYDEIDAATRRQLEVRLCAKCEDFKLTSTGALGQARQRRRPSKTHACRVHARRR
jgi:hypothetical protein